MTFPCGAGVLGHSGFSDCSSRVELLLCTGLVAPRHADLPRPGMEPMSPVLAGGFLTTGPPGKTLAGLSRLSPVTLLCEVEGGGGGLGWKRSRD